MEWAKWQRVEGRGAAAGTERKNCLQGVLQSSREREKKLVKRKSDTEDLRKVF